MCRPERTPICGAADDHLPRLGNPAVRSLRNGRWHEFLKDTGNAQKKQQRHHRATAEI
jgi:hypothetical protein